MKLGVLERCADSEWTALAFIIPKQNGTIQFISDFQKLNSMTKRKPFPIPKVQDVLQKLEGFTYTTSLDLNMGYWHVTLMPEMEDMCTITLPYPFGKYKYKFLPMGPAQSPDISQEKMQSLMDRVKWV